MAPIGREKSTAVIAKLVGNLLDIAPVQVHSVQFEVATAVGGKDNFVTLWRNRCFGIIAGGVCELFYNGPRKVGLVNIIGTVDGPHIFSFFTQRCLGTVLSPFVGRGIDKMLIVRQKIGTGRTALPGTDHRRLACAIFGLTRHQKQLVTAHSPLRVVGLKNNLLIVKTPIGFGIIAPKGDLF